MPLNKAKLLNRIQNQTLGDGIKDYEDLLKNPLALHDHYIGVNEP